ncbi:MAG: hypothetical protein RLZZ387_4412 [Chloroflexota bacterium]|jgi:HEAT repeat protein
MVDRGVFSRFRQQRDLTTYRQQLTAAIGRTPAIRALPELLNLPIPIVDSTGALTPPRVALGDHAHLAISGPPGSGRLLVMQQLALYYTRQHGPAGLVPVLLELQQFDDGVTAPEQLVEEHVRALHQEHLPTPTSLIPWRGRAAHHQMSYPDLAPWLLLVHGWEQLPANRRAAWRQALVEMAARGAALHLVVALPGEEAPWPGLRALRVSATPPTLLRRWLQQLCTPETLDAVEIALAPGRGLELCHERLIEVALLAWLAPRGGIPATRWELYERALAEVERPSEGLQDALRDAGRGALLGHPQAGRYALARRLVAMGRYEPLAELPPPDRGEVALLAVGMAERPEEVLAVLWKLRRVADDVVPALARCLRERPPRGAVWAPRIAAELGWTARERSREDAGEARQLLSECLPTLDAALGQLALRRGPRLLKRLLRSLPAELALRRGEAIAFSDKSDEGQAWAAADVLAERYGAGEGAPPVSSSDASLARWTYVQIMAGSEHRRRVGAAAAASIARSKAGPRRLATTGATLVSDRRLPDDVRLAGLELLATSGSAEAMETIRKAYEDSSAAVRATALDTLARVDAGAARAVLRATTTSAGAPWEVRLDAMLRLSESGGDPDVLVHGGARDRSLPLYARIRLVSALGQLISETTLEQLVADEGASMVVRAAAAHVWARRNPTAVSILLRSSAPELQAAACRGVSEAEAGPGLALEELLLELLNSAIEAGDLATAHAALGGIGKAGGEASAVALSRLLADAPELLFRAVPSALAHEAPTLCLDDSRLPEGLRLPLATTLARGMTPADRPTTLEEFLTMEAERLQAAAARALGAMGGDSAKALLRRSLGHLTGEASDAAVAVLGGLEGLSALGELLGAAGISQEVRWQIVRYLEQAPDSDHILRDCLSQGGLDPFLQGALVEALGRRGLPSSLLLLSRLARDSYGHPHVQEQAVRALGMLGEPAAEVALLRIFSDASRPVELRGLAAASLPAALSHEGRRLLRDTLRTERGEEPQVAGALQALGRARDREALALTMRYCLDDRPSVVRAAIEALADIGDDTVTPVLARAAQRMSVDHALRVHAIGGLLRLGGMEHRLMLQPYLEHRSTLLQLRALDVLIAAGAATGEVARIALDQGRSLPLRLRALEQVADAEAAAPWLTALAQGEGGETQLRCRAAEALGRLRARSATHVLAALAEASVTDTALRHRCIEALGRCGGQEAWAALSRMAEAGQADDYTRAWAAQALGESGNGAMP